MSAGSGSNTANNFRGAMMMVISQAAFVCNDAIMKLVSADLSLFQTIFLRGLFTTLLLGILVWYQGVKLSAVTKGDHRILSLRLVGEVGATLCYLTALFNMPIANSTAILQALPLAVTLGAALFLGEAVGWRRYSAILIGFCGVLIIVRPGAEGFNAYSFWALASVVFIVARDLATKRIASGIPSSLVALLTSIGLTITTGVLLPFSGWRPVELQSVAYLTGAGVFLVLGYLTVISAMRTGEISFVSPFRYTILIWAILLGLFVFGDVPDSWTLIGSFIVVATGIYTFYRERRLQKRDALELKRDVVAPEVLRHR
ncbi:DMT family transporter [Kiloniella laminariae]|uniref:DMT family transporter n=1 Tax=Kiloniella laminariae TaxID=454162 RepID=A0ABT4LF07_9PROT|nr:DMT family transporter [Kiloniella laminariae]MCZ4279685.1 DMT family transporter [Kiloniella laminariae]